MAAASLRRRSGSPGGQGDVGSDGAPVKPTTAYRFKVYDITMDDYRYPGAMSPKAVIDKIQGAEIIEGFALEVDASSLDGNRLFKARLKTAAAV